MKMSTRQRRRWQTRSRGHKAILEFRGKNHYLIGVKATENAKDKVTRCYLAHLIEVQSNNKKNNKTKNDKKIKKEKNTQKRSKTIVTKVSQRQSREQNIRSSREPWKRYGQQKWRVVITKKNIQGLPSHFKRYTV